MALHPSLMVPHAAPWAEQVVCVVQVPFPHTLAPPAPHVSPVPHVPHVSVPPHPSGMVPQFLPAAVHVVGVHAFPPSPVVSELLVVPVTPHAAATPTTAASAEAPQIPRWLGLMSTLPADGGPGR